MSGTRPAPRNHASTLHAINAPIRRGGRRVRIRFVSMRDMATPDGNRGSENSVIRPFANKARPPAKKAAAGKSLGGFVGLDQPRAATMALLHRSTRSKRSPRHAPLSRHSGPARVVALAQRMADVGGDRRGVRGLVWRRAQCAHARPAARARAARVAVVLVYVAAARVAARASDALAIGQHDVRNRPALGVVSPMPFIGTRICGITTMRI